MCSRQPPKIVCLERRGIVIDEKGEHDLSPKSDADWEAIVSGAATPSGIDQCFDDSGAGAGPVSGLSTCKRWR